MVYVDKPLAKYRGMTMCHMVADSTEELLCMADSIGVKRKWIQAEGTYREHFDVCKSKRALAVKNGAMEITGRQLAMKLREKREGAI